MNTVKDDGGPAFPGFAPMPGSSFVHSDEGMSLRDWFAGQIISGLFANADLSKYTSDEGYAPGDVERDYVSTAYRAADAMIAARSK